MKPTLAAIATAAVYIALLFGVYAETGPWTAIAISLITALATRLP